MKRYRNEWKFQISSMDKELLKLRLCPLLNYDKYSNQGVYHVRTLYFDDLKNRCARENEIGNYKKMKWRIRYYGTDSNHLFLECKEKLFDQCHKEKCAITKEEFECFLKGDVLSLFWNTNNRLIQKFCVDILNYQFRPKVIIDYDRTAFVEEGLKIRITMDENIEASYDCDSFLEGVYFRFPISKESYSILEVKFEDILPGYLKKMVEFCQYQKTSHSKYYYGRKTIEEVIL